MLTEVHRPAFQTRGQTAAMTARVRVTRDEMTRLFAADLHAFSNTLRSRARA